MIKKQNNYDRYKTMNKERYNKYTLSTLFMRSRIDKIVIPYVKAIRDKTILEVGLGYGYYTEMYMKNNNVTGYDINPNMGADLGIEIISGRAGDVINVGCKYDRVMSFCMTEYLDKVELKKFIDGSTDLLNHKGVFTTTIVEKKGLGLIYTTLARLKGINKYSYSVSEIKELLSGKKYSIKKIPTWLGISFMVLAEVKVE